ncbi:hypothetical protein SAMN04487851_11470 [Prevotella sp. tc2-28]|nr:hypothetical protein SAMN04487851_11470 [Prevotella sp. tc2-28]
MKKVTYCNLTQKEALEYTSKLVDFGLSLLIYAALNELLTSHNYLRQSKYYKQKVKLRANEALRLRNRKIDELRNAVYRKDFSETY